MDARAVPGAGGAFVMRSAMSVLAVAAAGVAGFVAAAAAVPPAVGSDDAVDVARFAETATFTRYASDGGPVLLPPRVSEAEAVAAMVAHHQDAIVGATEFLSVADDPVLRSFAERVVRVQSEQVAQMERWLGRHGGPPSGSGLWADMFCTVEDWGSDAGFLVTMIAHHEAAVAMYEGFVLNGSVTDVEMGLLLRTIGKGQVGEVAWMRQQLPEASR